MTNKIDISREHNVNENCQTLPNVPNQKFWA